jgi:pyrroline-5-carboxylate reductase
MTISRHSHPQLAFIGAGNMAQALATGLLAQGWPADRLTLSDVNAQALDALATRLKVNVSGDNQATARQAEIVLLAVKPQVMEAVCHELAPSLSHGPLIISIAAGITTERLKAWLGTEKLVRVMPNTPALVQVGAAGLYAGEGVDSNHRQLAETIVRSAGIALWFEDESQLDAVTAVSGSGPAYFFLLMESMMATARKLGLEDDSARKLVLQTALGAARLALQSEDDPAVLRRKVTSPGGTTAAAIQIFEEAGFASLVESALTAARDRSVELSGG